MSLSVLQQESYKLQLPVATVHPPVHQRQDFIVAQVRLSHFVTGQAAVLVARDWDHTLQVQFGHVALLGVVAVEAVVEAREHLLPLVLQPLVLAAQHSQSKHDEQHQDEAPGDGHGDDRRPEPHLFGRGQLLDPCHQVSVAVLRVATVIWNRNTIEHFLNYILDL